MERGSATQAMHGTGNKTPAGKYEGPATALGAGEARTFVVLDASGVPTSMGIELSDAALKGLPTQPSVDVSGWEYPLPLPPQAAVAGYRQVVVNWNPKGRPPAGVYDVPHFDFHFYLMSPEQRAAIKATPGERARSHKQPPADNMPAGYQLPEGTEEPRMGAHAIDPSGPEFHKIPFTKTFIYGFYNGQMTFLEPMVTRAFLKTNAVTTDTLKLPRKYSRPGYYPTRYSVSYDAASKEHRVILGVNGKS